MTPNKAELYFFLVLFLTIAGLAFLLFLPFLAPLALSAVFAVIFYPLFLWIKRVGGIAHDALSALLVVVIFILVLLVPLGFFSYMVFEEARSLFINLSSGSTDFAGALHAVEDTITRYAPGFELDVRGYAQQALSTITQSLGSVFAGTAQVVFALLLTLISFYYFLKDGVRFREALKSYSPLRNSYDDEIFERLKLTVNSVVKGSLLIALIQGFMTGIGFFIFGVPNPVLWGAIAGIAALIPSVGTALIIAPAVLYLFFMVSSGAAVGLLIWGVVAVGLIDNFLGPQFIGRGAQIHPLFILLSVLGGIGLFGPVGFILGPIVLSLLVVLAHIYSSLMIRDGSTS